MNPSPSIVTSPSRQLQATDKSGFTLFATTWALAGVFHLLSFVDWRWQTVRGGLLTAAILWFLLRPSSWQRFAALILTDWIVVPFAFPAAEPHFLCMDRERDAVVRIGSRVEKSRRRGHCGRLASHVCAVGPA